MRVTVKNELTVHHIESNDSVAVLDKDNKLVAYSKDAYGLLDSIKKNQVMKREWDWVRSDYKKNLSKGK